MVEPTCADSVDLLCTLFERCWQHPPARPHRGHPFVSDSKALIVFVGLMPQRRLFRGKAPRRWLTRHPAMPQGLGRDEGPQRTTLSRRSQALSAVVQACMAVLGQYAEALAPRLTSEDLSTDTSLCTAQGPVWHPSARQAGRLPDQRRPLATDGSWSTSGYPGWV
jgi:hypothetical protein